MYTLQNIYRVDMIYSRLSLVFVCVGCLFLCTAESCRWKGWINWQKHPLVGNCKNRTGVTHLWCKNRTHVTHLWCKNWNRVTHFWCNNRTRVTHLWCKNRTRVGHLWHLKQYRLWDWGIIASTATQYSMVNNSSSAGLPKYWPTLPQYQLPSFIMQVFVWCPLIHLPSNISGKPSLEGKTNASCYYFVFKASLEAGTFSLSWWAWSTHQSGCVGHVYLSIQVVSVVVNYFSAGLNLLLLLIWLSAGWKIEHWIILSGNHSITEAPVCVSACVCECVCMCVCLCFLYLSVCVCARARARARGSSGKRGRVT